ncbi:MAG TPA: type I-E CRISPR-associated protein Cas6/Cse3/CasE [Candidatus Cloacimonadota bacterium]|nr:type I-E CRISPR-associated protein Cas6/Cse3/CasE [Candidatus Cloacimonadota bacterium]
MIYLSNLLVDTGSDPDRVRPGRLWIGNVYNIHRRLSMAFPRYDTLLSDPNCLNPFDPSKLENRPFLFRLDNLADSSGQRAMIIVQSSLEPNWAWAFHNAPDFLAAPPQYKVYDPCFGEHDLLRFRIRLNPTVKSSIHYCLDSRTGEPGKHGKRLALTWPEGTSPESAVTEWFERKAEQNGFRIIDSKLQNLSWVYGSKLKSPDDQIKKGEVLHHGMRFRSALLEGHLEIIDLESFMICLNNGLGSAKSMGFGLFSVVKT